MHTATKISLVLGAMRAVRAAPLAVPFELEEGPTDSGEFVFRLCFSVTLVLLGGVFAGLTIGLMGQDEVYLQVISESGTLSEQKYARRVLSLLARGKHWVLVTLLLSNVITNETLPIVLDRLLGGGWPAVVSSTAAIVVFGEIIPQSICVRFGLPLGAYFAPFVQVLMYLLAPLGVPIAKLLDYVLGEDHGTIYKKAGLKSLVALHQSMGMERLNEDEVTIIRAVLDLKDKPISQIMTPIDDVFVLSSDAILNEQLVEQILHSGFNRIPIHAPGEPTNFVGMLLVRTLITYDPEDALPISAFSLATLPETSPETSCLNILNYFQEGKSHMVAVSNDPGNVTGAVGVVTLEDVIEELIGEEIVDESDVYVDVQRGIRRPNPATYRKNALRPSNRASDPKATSNRKITIKAPQASTANSVANAVANAGAGPSGSQIDTLTVASNAGTSTQPAPKHGYMPAQPQPHAHPSLPTLSPERQAVGKLPGAHYQDQESQTLSQLARSPGNIVTKVQHPDVEVKASEKEVLQQAKPTKPRQYSHSAADEEEERIGFSENVVRVNGVRKVVLQELSSSEDEGEAE